MNQSIKFAGKTVLFIFIFGIAVFILHKFEYVAAFQEIDNIVGMLPVVLICIFVVGAAWLLFARRTAAGRYMTVTVTVLMVISAVLFPNALYGNWWINPTVPNATQAAPDLKLYEPFSEGSKTVKLEENSTLKLAGDLPVLDGATALYPVYAAFAEATYDQNIYSPQKVLCTNTSGAYQSVIKDECDIAFVATASQKQLEAAVGAGADLNFTPIGREAFVFLVGKENPVSNLSYQQIRNIYSGKTARWKTLGWADGGNILAFQRPGGSGSQTGLQGIMGEIPIQVPQPLPDASLLGTNSLMKQVSVNWNGVQPAIGYSYRYYATTMYSNPDVKLLNIDGIAPTSDNIRSGIYPFIGDFYAVTNGEPVGNEKKLIDWILSPQGQEIIEKTGYTSIVAQ